MLEINTFSAGETVEAGLRLGRILKKSDVVCMTGDLGTGKTAFTNGIAAALGINGYITSPTFTIVNEYNAAIPLYHFDVYRIADPEEMFEIGFDEYIDGDGIVVIEWAELIKEVLPKECIWVKISKDLSAGIDTRIVNIQFIGNRYRGYEELMDNIVKEV